MFNTVFPEDLALFDKMWKNVVEPDRPPITMWQMRLARWFPKATDTHSEYEIYIACPRQKSVGECAALLRCLYYITAFVNTKHMSLSASLVLIERKCVYQQLPYTQTAVLQSDSNKD